jgi:hypothetical protein
VILLIAITKEENREQSANKQSGEWYDGSLRQQNQHLPAADFVLPSPSMIGAMKRDCA